MADVSSEGKRDFKQPSEASPSTNIRPDVGQNPNTQIGPYGQFEHTAFDASYEHTPFTSVNPSGPSGGSKFQNTTAGQFVGVHLESLNSYIRHIDFQ